MDIESASTMLDADRRHIKSSAPRTCQQTWLLDGTIQVTQGSERYVQREGDCLAMQLDRPAVFHNPTAEAACYAVVIATHSTG
jgi:hypothetical protein